MNLRIKIFVAILTIIFGLQNSISSAAQQGPDASLTPNPEAEMEYNKGVAAGNKGDKKLAEESYRKAIKIDPRYALAYNNLGNLLQAAGNVTDAEAAYQKAADNDHKLMIALFNLAELQFSQKRMSDVERSLTKMFQEFAEIQTPVVGTEKSVSSTGDPKKAAAEPDTNHTLSQANLATAHFQLGFVEASENKHTEAIAEYRASIKADSTNALCHHYLATSLVAAGDQDEAIAEYREATRLNPKLSESYFNLGALLYRSGKNSEAIEAFESYLKLEPNSPQRSQIEGAIKQMQAASK